MSAILKNGKFAAIHHAVNNSTAPAEKMKCIFLFLLITSLPALAQQYSVDWHKIAGGGTSTNGQYVVNGTIGQPDATLETMTGGNYSVAGGFWSLISTVQTAGAPMLLITHSGNSVKISWPYPSTGWTLQQNSNLESGTWTPSSGVSNDGVNNFISIASPTGNLFFRLQSR